MRKQKNKQTADIPILNDRQTEKQTNNSQNNNNKANTDPRQTVKKSKKKVNRIYGRHALSLAISIA